MTSAQALALLASAGPLYAQELNIITVTGDAEVKVVPNQVLLYLGVETRDRLLPQAKKANDQAVKAVLEALGKFRIEPADVQTDFMTVDIHYDSRVETIVDHYRVEKAISVLLRDVSKFEDVLSAALETGANHVYEIEFSTTQLRQYRDQARDLATKAAIEKANDLAAAAGLKVAEKPLGISSYSYGGGAWYGRRSRGSYGNVSQNVYQGGEGRPIEGSVALGKISVTASVSMRFRLE